MYELYKKVFNNKYLKSKIYNYVKFKDDIENNKDLKQCYINLNQYYNVQDLDIIQLIKRKEFNLLFKMIDNYFDYAIKDPIKYWYYIIQPSKLEMNELLKLIDLGFDRFKLLYNEFKTVFNQQDQSKVLKSVIISGNIEIFNYLTKECGYKLINFNINWWHSEIEKFNCGGNIKLFKLIMEDHFTNYSRLNEIEITDEIIKSISLKIRYYHYKRPNYTSILYGDINNSTPIKHCWNSEYPCTSDNYFKIYKYLLKKLNPIVEIDKIYELFSTCFSYQDLSLAKALVHYINNNKINYHTATSTTTTTTTKIKLQIILASLTNRIYLYRILFLSDSTIKILNYILENLKDDDDDHSGSVYYNFNDIFIKVERPLFKHYGVSVSESNPYRINIEKINDNDLLIKSLIDIGYLTNSIEEFNYILSNQELLDKFNSYLTIDNNIKLSIYLIQISTLLVNLEYFKLVYNYFLPRSKEALDLDSTFYKCLDTSSEIYSYIISIYQDDTFPPISSIDSYNYQNLFFGDVNSLNHFIKLVNYPKDFMFNFIYALIYKDGFDQREFIKFLLSKAISLELEEEEEQTTEPTTNTTKPNRLLETIRITLYNNNFEIFKLIIDNYYTDKQERLNLYKLMRLNDQTKLYPLYQSLIEFANQDYNQNISFRNLLLNSNYIYKRGNKPSCGGTSESSSLEIIKNNLDIIKSNSTKTLDLLLFENSQISNYLPNSSKYFISNLIGTNLKKLIYSLNLDNQINNSNYLINNFKLLIQESINSNNLIIIKYLINNGSGGGSGEGDLLINDNFKNQFYSYLLFYSILSFNENRRNRNNNNNFTGKSLLVQPNQIFNELSSGHFKYYDISLLLKWINIEKTSITNFKSKLDRLKSFTTTTNTNQQHLFDQILLNIQK